jgi:hypothetical protein
LLSCSLFRLGFFIEVGVFLQSLRGAFSALIFEADFMECFENGMRKLAGFSRGALRVGAQDLESNGDGCNVGGLRGFIRSADGDSFVLAVDLDVLRGGQSSENE